MGDRFRVFVSLLFAVVGSWLHATTSRAPVEHGKFSSYVTRTTVSFQCVCVQSSRIFSDYCCFGSDPPATNRRTLDWRQLWLPLHDTIKWLWLFGNAARASLGRTLRISQPAPDAVAKEVGTLLVLLLLLLEAERKKPMNESSQRRFGCRSPTNARKTSARGRLTPPSPNGHR